MTFRPSLALPLASVLVAVLLAGCERGRGGPEPERDLSLLYRMIELDSIHRGIEPFLRNTSKLDDVAQAADAAAELARSELLVTWTERPEFQRDPVRWQTFRAELEQAAVDAAQAARAADLDALHDAYSRMDGTCIACHKRYLETY
jgi:cytochrome c556